MLILEVERVYSSIMIPFRKSLGFRLLLVSIFLLSLPLLIDSYFLIKKSYEDAIEEAKSYLIEIANQRELPLSQIQPLNAPFFRILEYYFNLDQNFPTSNDPEIDKKLQELAEVNNFYNIALFAVTDDNRYIITNSSKASYLGEDRTYLFDLIEIFKEQNLERGFANYIAWHDLTLQPYIIVSYPVFSSESGRLVGVIAIWDNISYKLEQLLLPEKTKYQANFALLLPSDIVFAASDPSFQFQYFEKLTPSYRESFLTEEPFAKNLLPQEPLSVDTSIGAPFFEFTWNGETQIGYIKKFPTEDFALLVYASRKSIFTQPLYDLADIYGIFAGILVCGMIISYGLTRKMARPLAQLSKTMEEIKQGQLDARYSLDPLGFEINELGNIFNDMVDHLLINKHLAEEERVKRETISKELFLGQNVQQSLLPVQMPSYPGVDLARAYIPAIEVGGDFYDAFIKDKNGEGQQLVLNIADASGKGVQACFYSLGVRNMLRIYAKAYEDTGKIMSATNNLFCEDSGDTGMFVTAVLGIYDHATRNFNYYSCGHNPLLLRRKSGEIEKLQQHGIALGVLPMEKGSEDRIQLHPGDMILFYTDGITEAHNTERKLFGEKRLIDFLIKEGDKNADEIVQRLLNEVNLFSGKAPQFDDITILAMKIKD